MSEIKVKICGITSRKQALELDALKIDFLGFNFYPNSKRYFAPDLAAKVISELKYSLPVGVFVNEPLSSLTSICDSTRIKYAQLHGSENDEYMKSVPLPIIKAIPVDETGYIPVLPKTRVEFLLFDTKAKGQFGGTGQPFPWDILNTFSEVPFFLAGGIGPHNISEAIKKCTPYALDLNSKVEVSPGIKDIHLIKECLEILNSA